MRLTQTGSAFLDGARRTLAEADRAVDSAQRAAAGELGQLRLAFSWSARFETLPALGRAFHAGHPHVELLSQEMWNAQMIHELRAGTIDAAVSLCPETASGIESELVRTEEVIAVFAPRDTLPATEGVRLASLADQTFLLFPRELAPRLHDVLVGICHSAGFEPSVRSESFHTSWDLDFLADTALVALAPRSVVKELPKRVATAAVTEPASTLETHLIWRADDRSPPLEAFRTVARTVF